MSKIFSHDEALDALCGCALTVTFLSYEEVIKGYFSLRRWPDPETVGGLYAAAPDMLAALMKMRDLLRQLQPALNVMAREVMDDIIADQIEPAIAKATRPSRDRNPEGEDPQGLRAQHKSANSSKGGHHDQ